MGLLGHVATVLTCGRHMVSAALTYSDLVSFDPGSV